MGPISELTLGLMDKHEAAWMQHSLTNGFGCSFSEAQDGGYLVQFPSGSTEERNPEADPRYREDTLIKLPGNKLLRKVVKWPCIRPGCTHIYLWLSDEAEETPLRRRLRHEAR